MVQTTQDHWHIVLEDILAATLAGNYGHELYEAVQDKALRNKKWVLALKCGKCVGSMFFSVDRIYHNHFHKNADAPTIKCPECNHSGNHHYIGIEAA